MSPLLALWLVPPVTALASRRVAPSHVWRNTGIGLGLVVAPASLGLYGLYYLGPGAAVLGMLGLVLELFHGAPGYYLAVAIGLTPSHTVVTGAAALPAELLNAVVWSIVYGSLGRLIDQRAQRSVSTSNAV